MSRIKSIRINGKIENMLKHIKKKNKKKNETDIFFKGIYIQFEKIAKIENYTFKKEMYLYLDEELEAKKEQIYVSKEVEILQKKFDKICDLLEVLCSTDGLLLQEEFEDFIYYIYGNIEIKEGKRIREEHGEICEEDTTEDEEDATESETTKTEQYDKIYRIILENDINENENLSTKEECRENLDEDLTYIYEAYFSYSLGF